MKLLNPLQVKPLTKRPRARTVSAVPTSSWGALGSDKSKRSAEVCLNLVICENEVQN